MAAFVVGQEGGGQDGQSGLVMAFAAAAFVAQAGALGDVAGGV